MASHRSSDGTVRVILTEDDIPGASLAGRNPSSLKNDELKFWLRCRGDSLKGLKTKAQLVKRVQDYVENGRDKMLVDPDGDKIYTKRKARFSSLLPNDYVSPVTSSVKYPSDGWGKSLERMPCFTRAEMNQHVANSGKRVANAEHHSIPTNLKKAKTFLKDEYLKEIEANSDQRYFYLKANCYHSFRKSEAPHDLRFAMCIVSGQVIHANCSCKAGKVGYCNHILALMFKACKFSLFDSKSTEDLCQEDDEQPDLASTSQLQRWHKKGRGDKISAQPSHVDQRYKRSLLNTMLNRAYRLSSTKESFTKECQHLKRMFTKLKYPVKLINSAIAWYTSSTIQSRHETPTELDAATQKPVRITLPFKDQKSADTVRHQLKDLGRKIGTDLQPVFTSLEMENITQEREGGTDFVEKSEKDSWIAELKDKVAAALANNEELDEVVSKLKEKVVDLERKYEKCDERLFSFKNIASNDSLVAFYTGFPNYQTMMALYKFLDPGEQGENINYWLSGKGFDSSPKSVKKRRPRILKQVDEFLLTLCRLKQGLLSCIQPNYLIFLSQL
ncbi:hypothetical protein AWC38_SpisGene16382 [Stylophora pistillata]|uniref:SWIM-type domain-containing protein n=1 Tax=Stylophora pistillata TaxID=50429 RepID=A0A2B4RQZ3_STYPI|nr:hypothetical protein AWC38_SpisGene16382 [Stylophora pistillata]